MNNFGTTLSHAASAAGGWINTATAYMSAFAQNKPEPARNTVIAVVIAVLLVIILMKLIKKK